MGEGELRLISSTSSTAVRLTPQLSFVQSKDEGFLKKSPQVSSFDMVPKLLKRAREEVGEILSAFEFLDSASLGAIWKVSPHLLRRCED